jgi:hypothetical protein
MQRIDEAELLARGDGVFSATACWGPWRVTKALRGATLWEVENPLAQIGRTFHNDYAAACDFVEAQPMSDRIRRLREMTGWELVPPARF